ncbi:MAG: hypothetical protein ACK5A0_10740 [Polaromonas sp.]|jgi:hypothetical protein
MGYKWKPSAAQRAEYGASMRAAEAYTFIHSPHPIRTGDSVEFFDTSLSALVGGVIEKHSYGDDRGQHTFSVRKEDGSLRLIKGRNLYPRLTKHIHIHIGGE